MSGGSTGERVNDPEVFRKLMFRVWRCVDQEKPCPLTPEMAHHVLAALQDYEMRRTQLREFGTGMFFQIQDWSPSGFAKIVAWVDNVSIAHACFDAAMKEFPRSVLTMRHGARLMRFDTGEPDPGRQEMLAKIRAGRL